MPDREVDVAPRQAQIPATDHQLDFEAGVLLHELAHARHEEVGAEDLRRRNANLPDDRVCGAGRQPPDRLGTIGHGRCSRGCALTGGRQSEAAIMTVEKLNAEHLLEGGDAPADGRMRDAKRSRGGGKAPHPHQF